VRSLHVIVISALALVLAAATAIAAVTGEVTATVETPALFDDEEGGDADADDPAIWVNGSNAAASLVLGTVKNAGLRVYDLAGAEVQAFAPPAAPGPDDEPGRFNNVDIVRGVKLAGGKSDLAVVTDRGRDQIRIYRIDGGATPLVDITAANAPLVFSADQAEVNEQTTAYGIATFKGLDGSAYVVTSRRHRTELALLRLKPRANGTVGYSRIATTSLPSSFGLPDGSSWSPCEDPGELPQVEGMVVDPSRGLLFAAQEDVGVWVVTLWGNRFGVRLLIDRVREFGIPGTFDETEEECVLDEDADPGFGGDHLSADAEGLTIYRDGTGPGYLFASSQGSDEFVVYGNRGLGGYRATVVVADGDEIDGVQESDGAAVVSTPLGSAFPHGLLAVHDGHEEPGGVDGNGEERAATNFKFIRVEQFLEAAGL
jgi:3-phytase